MPKVSIITPTYNRADYIAYAIRSAQEQTFQDWEMVIVDDGSTDNTIQIVSSRMLNDDRIVLHTLTHNSGSPVVPRNYGVRVARGKYVAFLDSDDLWHPEKLEVQVGYLETIGEPFAYHNLLVKYVDVGKQELWAKMSTCHSGEVFPFLLRKNFIPTSSVLVTRELYRKHGSMDISLEVSHDWDLWLKIAFENNVHYIPDVLGGTLSIHYGSVISEVHKRRRESRKVIQKWVSYVDGMWYRRLLCYYYLMEIIDILPEFMKKRLRKWWYEQSRFK